MNKLDELRYLIKILNFENVTNSNITESYTKEIDDISYFDIDIGHNDNITITLINHEEHGDNILLIGIEEGIHIIKKEFNKELRLHKIFKILNDE